MKSNIKICRSHTFWLAIAISVFLVNQVPFITDMRPVMYDEAWYANTAYNFSQGEGFLNTVVGSGGNANFLLPLLTGTMFWIFGYSLFTIRLTAVLCGMITMIFLHLCMKELKSSVEAEVAVLAFFVSITLYNTIFRFGRPECASIMCMTGGVWFLLRYMRENSCGNMIGVACFTYLATMGHPYALLFFALAGVWLLVQTIRSRQWIKIAHLSLLLVAASAAILSMAYISSRYDIASGGNMSARFSMKNIAVALPEYLKEFFCSKTTLYMIVLLPVIGWCCANREKRVRTLAYITIAYLILFPFLFSTDMMMIGLGADYVALIGTILIAPCVERVLEFRYKKVYISIFSLYCVMNFGISYYFNYHVKYEKCNSILENELRAIVPTDAVVFTPLRQYPMVMENKCYSDHYRGKLPVNYGYIIMNSQDKDVYYHTIEIQKQMEDYELIYERTSKQYGMVNVYKNKSKL